MKMKIPPMARWDDLAVSLPGPHGFVAVTPKGVTKERALQQLLGQLSPGMTAGNCIAFGDGMNDIGMLTWAGIGIAMENAGSDPRDNVVFVQP